MPGDVKRHAADERVGADQRADHPHQLRTLAIHRGRVKIVDRDVALRPHGMGQRPAILAELQRPQHVDLLDAAQRGAADILAVQLVAEHGEPLLERQLEPVAAGHPVAGPVMEILVRDHPLDRRVIVVGRGLRAGQH